jgi:hypothetical protein
VDGTVSWKTTYAEAEKGWPSSSWSKSGSSPKSPLLGFTFTCPF